MKYLKYIVLSSCLLLFLFWGQTLSACSSSPFYPYGYRIYRGYDVSQDLNRSHRQENCLLWQKMTSVSIPVEDIEEVIYDYNIAQLRKILVRKQTNSFSKWLNEHQCKEMVSFLILAKACEIDRAERNSPWYYPSRNDGTAIALEDVVSRAKFYEGKLFKDRYILQAIRAMFSLQDYQGCIDYWNVQSSWMEKGLIYDLCESYVAGARFRVGQKEVAMEYYIKTGDMESIRFCAKKMGLNYDNIDLMNLVRKSLPNCKDFPMMMQEEMDDLERWLGWPDLTYQQRFDKCLVSDSEKGRRLLELCHAQMSDQRVEQRAFWAYSAACISDLLGKPAEANLYLVQAENSSCSEFLSESIQVLRMYLDAKLCRYDSQYEEKLFRQINWLDGMIQRDLGRPEEVQKKCEDAWKLKMGISFYYWNDMLRKILISEVCPRMEDQGKVMRALQLYNMADNRLGNLLGKEYDSVYRSYYNYVDYSNYFFKYANWVSIDDFKTYIACIKSPDGPFSYYLNQMGYEDEDYLYDLLGTKYLREMDYENAVLYLGKVSGSYQSRTNVKKYMYLDPFSIEKRQIYDNADYKYSFAKAMFNLQGEISNLSDNPDRKAVCLVRLGTGIRNAVGFCWALTEYHYSQVLPLHDKKKAYKRAEQLFEEALSIVQDPELGADLNRRLYRWKTAVTKYPETRVSAEILRKCDELCDYKTEWAVKGMVD